MVRMTTIQMTLPDDVLSAMRRSPEEFARDMRLAAATHWYVRGLISQEQAARIAGMNRVDFLLGLKDAGVDAVIVDMEDLKREIAGG